MARSPETPRRTLAMTQLSSPGQFNPGQQINADEFLLSLRGLQGVRKYREMRDNDPTIGAFLTALELMIRAVDWHVDPANPNDGGKEQVEFVESVLSDMAGTWEEFIAQACSMLAFGFAPFETVFKRRPDGRIGLHKLSPIAQWTVQRFEVNENGDLLGIQQLSFARMSMVEIPASKLLLFRTTSANADPAGRSILRNAYLSYYYISHIQTIESIAIERELNGLPVLRIPSEYLKPTASAAQVAFRTAMEEIGKRVKRNEQGFVMLPSDVYKDPDGKPSSQRLVEFELMASSGSRDIDTSVVITRHQQDMARSALADFLMLGQSSRGSFALSKDKSDLFLRSIEGYLNMLAAVINRQLLPRLWALNGFDPDMMPTLRPGQVAPVDLAALGDFVAKMTGSGAQFFPDDRLEEHIRDLAGLPAPEADPDLLP